MCISKFRSKEVYSAEGWANEIEHIGGTHHKILKTRGTKFKFGKEKGHLRALSKKVNLISEILARPSLRREHLGKPQDEKSVPAKQHGILARKIHKLKAENKATFYSLVEIKAPVLVSKNTEERMFVVDSGASMHMLSKKDLSSDENGYFAEVQNPYDGSDRHRLVSFDTTSIFALVFPNTEAGFSAVICWCFTRHCCWHRNFQLSTSVFHGVFEFCVRTGLGQVAKLLGARAEERLWAG